MLSGYTSAEIEEFTKVFRTVPSYDGESISSKDLPAYLQSINYIQPMATYEKYVEYADQVLGGRMELSQTMKYLRAVHDPLLVMKEYLKNFDQNNDGYVSKEEFELSMETVKVHDPRVKHVSYETFLKEADTNDDGKIGVAECEEWLKKHLVL